MWFVCPNFGNFQKKQHREHRDTSQRIWYLYDFAFFLHFFSIVFCLLCFFLVVFCFMGRLTVRLSAPAVVSRTGSRSWKERLQRMHKKTPRKLIKLFISIGAVPGGLGAAPHGDLFTNTAAG